MGATGDTGAQLPAGLEASPVPTGVVDLAGTWTATNPALDTLIGSEHPALADVVDEPGVEVVHVLDELSGALQLRLAPAVTPAGEAVITPLDRHHRLVQILDRSESAALATRLATTTAAMSRFVSRVSHDLKNAMATTAGFAELLLESGATGTLATYAERVTASTARTTEVLDDLIAEARRAVGRERPDQVDLTVLVEEVRMDLAELLADRAAILETAAGLPTVRTDRRALRRILALLVDNAVTHHPGAATIRIDVRQSDGEVEVLVDDDGPGIAVEDRLRVLAPGIALGEAAGRGLGLTAAEANARRIGATIGFEDSPVGGTRATVSLPQRRAGDAEQPLTG